MASLLDLAPWAMPEAYQAGTVARFGQRLRSRLIKDARGLVLVRSQPRARGAPPAPGAHGPHPVIPLAARPAFGRKPPPAAPAGAGAPGARRALRGLRGPLRRPPGPADAVRARSRPWPRRPPPAGLADDPWPPRVCLVGATPGDRASMSRAAVRAGVADAIAYAPRLADDRLAALVAGARVVGPAGPLRGLGARRARRPGGRRPGGGERGRRAARGRRAGRRCSWSPGTRRASPTAIRAAWSDDDLHAALVAATRERADGARTWADVARETRAVWAEVARPAPML